MAMSTIYMTEEADISRRIYVICTILIDSFNCLVNRNLFCKKTCLTGASPYHTEPRLDSQNLLNRGVCCVSCNPPNEQKTDLCGQQPVAGTLAFTHCFYVSPNIVLCETSLNINLLVISEMIVSAIVCCRTAARDS